MTIVESTETEQDWQKVERTETVRRVKCDVCGHEFDEDEWDGNEFAVNPGIEREAHSIGELSELFDAYHTGIPTHVVNDGYDGNEMVFDVPKKHFVDVLEDEVNILQSNGRIDDHVRKEMGYVNKLGTSDIYVQDGTIHHFRYVINIDESADDYKHVCDDCYEVLFE
jgi:hypothetical protein